MNKEFVKTQLLRFLRRWFLVEKEELSALVWSFIYFFSLLSTNYILRPFREEMGITGGVENLQWLFTGTFIAILTVVPIFGWITKRYPRQKFLPWVYLFFAINILLYYVLFKVGVDPAVLARTFFIWISVFNVFVVSVFWSFMTDIFSNKQSKRLFGVVAAGGSAGAITGPSIAAILAIPLGPVNLLLVATGFLLISLLCISKLITWSKENQSPESNTEQIELQETRLGGSALDGINAVFKSRYLMGICALIICYTAVSTFLYFEQAHIVERTIGDSASRTTLFAGIDLTTNVLAISSQLFITNRFIRRFGLAIMLAFIPALVMFGFISLSLATILPILIAVQVVHRAGNFSLLRPGREILFTVTSRGDRYKAKNFIDTAVYRGSDAATGWIFAGLTALGLSLSTMAFLAVPIAAIWAITGFIMGRKQHEKKRHSDMAKINLTSTI